MRQVFVFIDYENVQPTREDFEKLDLKRARTFLFHGVHQKRPVSKLKARFPELRVVPVTKTGNNAVDFHLVLYLGYYIHSDPKAWFLVVAKDTDYDRPLAHARARKVDVRRSKKIAGVPHLRINEPRVAPKAPALKGKAAAPTQEARSASRAGAKDGEIRGATA
jgi:hypothetical protein